MLGQIFLPDEKMSLPLQVELDQADLSENVASRRSTRLRWTGLGFSVLMLIGLSVCALHSFAPNASAEAAPLVPEVASYMLAPGGMHPARHPEGAHAVPADFRSASPLGFLRAFFPIVKLPVERQSADLEAPQRSSAPTMTMTVAEEKSVKEALSFTEEDCTTAEECPVFYSEGYGLAKLQVAGKQLQLIEEEQCTIDSGSCIWDAGLALALTLGNDPSTPGKNVLELGSGTGIGGLSAATAGADVVLSDRSDADGGSVRLLKQNIELNEFEGRVVAEELKWGHQAAAGFHAKGPFDLICGSDLLYDPSSHEDLLDTLVELSTPGHTEVMLTYPIRYTEDLFLQAAEEHFTHLETYFVEGLQGVDVLNVQCTRLRRNGLGEEWDLGPWESIDPRMRPKNDVSADVVAETSPTKAAGARPSSTNEHKIAANSKSSIGDPNAEDLFPIRDKFIADEMYPTREWIEDAILEDES